MRLAIIGDLHGRFDQLEAVLREACSKQHIDAAVQVGDFGFFENILPASRPSFRLPVPLYAVCGNHDDHDYLARARRDGSLARWTEGNLFYQARASVVTVGGVCLGFIGGALHADRPQRRHGGNVITPDEADRAAKLFEAARPEVIVSHSCPANIGIGMRSTPELAWGVAEHVLMAGYDPGPHHDCGEAQLTRLWRAVPARPRLWCFGHFHVAREAVVEGTRFFCAPRIDPSRAPAVWDSETGQTT